MPWEDELQAGGGRVRDGLSRQRQGGRRVAALQVSPIEVVLDDRDIKRAVGDQSDGSIKSRKRAIEIPEVCAARSKKRH